MSKKENEYLNIRLSPKKDMTNGEAVLHILGGFGWIFRTLFWGFMVHTFTPILGSIVPKNVEENILWGCMANGIRLLEEAHDKGYITEECYNENKDNLG